ncbi:MAG: hypothetical protein KGR26_16195, partial [Cyanobacteria bacterium REEB65]|nr:hypothetical protein [Cyanobacteria bacterium REEB65]
MNLLRESFPAIAVAATELRCPRRPNRHLIGLEGIAPSGGGKTDVEIRDIIIEREDSDTYCGVLTY